MNKKTRPKDSAVGFFEFMPYTLFSLETKGDRK